MIGCVAPAFATLVAPMTANAVIVITAALMTKLMRVLRVMSLLWVGAVTVAATGGDRITQRVVRDRETS
jgi:hypothetical protein